MKKWSRPALLSALLWCIFVSMASGQTGNLKILKEHQKYLQKKKGYVTDTAYLNISNQIAFLYADSYPDSALTLAAANITHARQAGYPEGESDAYKITGNAYVTKGDYAKALEWYQKSLETAQASDLKTAFPKIRNNIGLVYMNQGNYTPALNEFYAALKSAQDIRDRFVESSTLNNIAIIHFYQGKLKESEQTYRQTLAIARELKDTIGLILAYNNIAEVNIERNALPDALKNLSLAYPLAVQKNNPEMLAIVSHSLGSTYFRLDSLQKAVTYFQTAAAIARQNQYSTSTCKALIGLARVYFKQGHLTEALKSGQEALRLAQNMGHTQLLRDANEILADIYEKKGNGRDGLAHYKAFKVYSDSLRNLESERAATRYDAELEFSKKEENLNRKNTRQRWLIFSAFAAAASLGVILLISNRNKRRLNENNKELQHKNVIIESQRIKAEETLEELKSTQTQLIQSAKMASLGELTAGIAHEIQNPLNFVNNFSETSIDLMEEMQAELDKGNAEEVKSLASEVVQNMERINQHGKRADSIVKGMLEHSRNVSGQKELTDINEIAEEFTRISYRAFQTKDKLFEAIIETKLDPNIDNIPLVRQDIGRVIVNLLNNAFYAVHEKFQKSNASGYKPAVKVTTERRSAAIIIMVGDNGTGIPEHLMDKVFQPFFTTKPTGQGVGLGLSLSFDIVTKGNGGTIEVASKEGEGCLFTVTLPT